MDGKTTAQICLNEEIVEKETEEGQKRTAYAYDFNEWTEEDVDQDAITAAPDDYIDYQPEKELTTEEKAEKALQTPPMQLFCLEVRHEHGI